MTQNLTYMDYNKNQVISAIINPFQRFFRIEASGGIVLLSVTVVALVLANSGLKHEYHHFWENYLTLELGSFSLSKTVHHWINDGLMAIFFFVVGLEIKREILAGELSTIKLASLPIFAAIGGMLIPALVYLGLNNNPEAASGWGVPMATDIAFSLGILSLLGKKVPLSLKVFLVAFAIVDDLGAVLVIALFYSSELEVTYLLYSLALFTLLIVFNRMHITRLEPYMVVGWVIWYMFLQSGLHPTIAGVLIAFTIPVYRKINVVTFRNIMERNLQPFCQEDCIDKMTLTHQQLHNIDHMQSLIHKVQSPVQSLEHKLHGFVTYVVMPVFALANAGVTFEGVKFAQVFSSLSLNIELSLLLGKVIGIVVFAWIAVRLGIANMPESVKWPQIIGVGLLGGIGFTMSLFISNLAFISHSMLNQAKIGILVGSLLSGVCGYFLLRYTLKKSPH